MHRSAHWLRTTTIIASAVVFRPAIPTVPWPLLLSLSTMLFVWRQQEQLLVERPQAESINRMRWHVFPLTFETHAACAFLLYLLLTRHFA